MAVKIIHCADFHFDTPFSSVSALQAEKRREDLRETFGRMISIAKEERIDLLLISGDLFDSKNVMQTTIDYMINKFNEIPNIKVFIAPGNHDPYDDNSVYKLLKWPSNVHIFSNTLEKIELHELNTCVYGVGFSKRHENQCLIKDFKLESDSKINIMVLHGDLVSQEQSSSYNPIPTTVIQNSKLDYMALGHQHQYSGINREGRTHWSYSGNPEGRGFDELGSKGIIIGEVSKNYVKLGFKEICKRKYIEKEIDISDISTYEEIANKIRDIIKESFRNKNLYKVIITGDISEDFIIKTDIIQDKVENDFYFIKIVDKTKIKLDYSSLKNEKSLKGLFIKKMLEKIINANNQEEKQQYQTALKIGLQALNDKELIIE